MQQMKILFPTSELGEPRRVSKLASDCCSSKGPSKILHRKHKRSRSCPVSWMSPSLGVEFGSGLSFRFGPSFRYLDAFLKNVLGCFDAFLKNVLRQNFGSIPGRLRISSGKISMRFGSIATPFDAINQHPFPGFQYR